MSTSPRTLLVMSPATFAMQFGPSERERLETVADLVTPTAVAEFDTEHLAQAEVLITSWGTPEITDAVLDAAPHLRAIIHAAGSVRSLVPPDISTRGIVVTSAADLNAIPVAEFTLAAIILAGKRALPLAGAAREHPGSWEESFAMPRLSNFGRSISLVGFSRIGRRVLGLLPMLETGPVRVADPFADADEVARAGAELAPLPEALAHAEILSLHAPLLASTRLMIGAEELAALPDGATLINTARGGLIDHEALLRECASGRIDAILDVTDPEPLRNDHPLLSLPNVTVTPHVAGSLGSETRRLARFAIDALIAHAAGDEVPGTLSLEESRVSA